MPFYICLLSLVLSILLQISHAAVPDWVTYPGEKWEWLTADEAGLKQTEWDNYIAANAGPSSCGGDIHTGNRWGTCVQRGGYMLHCWGNPDCYFQSASLGKAFNGFVLQLAIDKGLVTGAEHITDVWPDCPSHCGDRSTLDNLFRMKGGFATSNGFSDGCDNTKCTSGDKYSSGGMWRLMQALTYVFNKDLKDVLDEELFSKIGIKPDAWYLMSGEEVHSNNPPPNAVPEQKSFYPSWTSDTKWYGCFVDPPYKVRGHIVRGGGGWALITPKDLCRVGLLLASGGYWDGKKLITKTFRVTGHAGCGNSDLKATGGTQYFAWGRVSTNSVSFPSSNLIKGEVAIKKHRRATEAQSHSSPHCVLFTGHANAAGSQALYDILGRRAKHPGIRVGIYIVDFR